MFAPLSGGPDELSPDEARAMSKAVFTFVAGSQGNLRATLEQEHGGAIDFAALTPCDRVIPISAPFLAADLPAEAQYVRLSGPLAMDSFTVAGTPSR